MILKKRSEKILFFSLWGIIMIGIGLWVFRPSAHEEKDPIPPVLMGDELITWFRQAAVKEMTSTTFTVEVKLQKKYAEEMKGDKRYIHLAYHFMRDTTILSQGVAEVAIQPEGLISVILPNPNRVSPKHILLSLAH